MKSGLLSENDVWRLLDCDGAEVYEWSTGHPTAEAIEYAIRGYVPGETWAPFVLTKQQRVEVWEYDMKDDRPYKMFGKENKPIVPEVARGRRKVILR